MKISNVQWFDMSVALVIAVVVCLPSFTFGFLSLPSTKVARLADGLIKRSYADNKGQFYQPHEKNGSTEATLPPPVEEDDTDAMETKDLYEILGASPDATRGELKKCYVRMAKVCHPDALVGSDKSSAMTLVDGRPLPEFSDVAAAWEVLGDSKKRRRYDRNVRAAKWSKIAQSFANEQLETVVPAVSDILEKVAVPFLRRTTATTVAVGQAVAKGMKTNNNEKELKVTRDALADTIVNAVEAGQQAGRAIDSMELTEKSQELEERAKQEAERAVSVAQELATITEKRLFGTLQSSDFALSSEEALQVLDILGLVDEEISMFDRAMRKCAIQEEIDSLKKTEDEFSEKLSTYEATDSEWNGLLQQQELAKEELTVAKQAEIEARKMLADAQQQVAQSKASLVHTSDRLRAVEYVVKKNASEMDRVTVNLSKKQERVRAALRKKAEDKIKEDIVMTEDDLTSLRRKEIQLMGENTQLERMVSRLQNKAESLRERAQSLDRWQNLRRSSSDNQNLESVSEAAQ